MKRMLFTLTLLVGFSSFATANPNDFVLPQNPTTEDYQLFSKNLVSAIKSDNLGLKLSAMQQAINYGDLVNVDTAVFDVVRLYRSNKDENTRILALMTLRSMQHDWAMDFLRRSIAFEKSDKVRELTQKVVYEYYQRSKA